MERAEYLVVAHQGQWKIRHADKHYGPYSIQSDAIASAIETAKRAIKEGFDARVLIESVSGNTRTAWANDAKS